ncbi:hypothetical protein HUE87_10505 [Candidatus Sulfurimonas marisnigri]|uniref:Uncharacterized protein n=1 Tax=Candidatus Sulfurimonas marisnigri TaxID=2740405 RepID=A0A7S7RQ41_9BACT|nr:hypothetical protein [Candidatus Sulfurimonas marisnigri]QOY54296.1 hypothetical protein HUE87_10505 [Candidatus Sulfurimonas marisnigri]
MKTVIFVIMTFFMFSPLGASSETLKQDEFVLDVFSNDFIDIKPISFGNFVFKVNISNSLLELENRNEKNSSLINRVVFWMNYSF